MAQMIAGALNPQQRRIYREHNKRIERLGVGYQNNDIIGFLRGISYNLSEWTSQNNI